jgi:hypothetical protein
METTTHLTARQLLDFLLDCARNGADLDKVIVNYRQDFDSDVMPVVLVEEDLYDRETNNVLESIVLVSDDYQG